MSATNDGGPAFPIKINHLHHIADESGKTIATASQDLGTYPGMSLRDWFAGMALSGYAGRGCMTARDTREQCEDGIFYTMADAMIAARNGKEQP